MTRLSTRKKAPVKTVHRTIKRAKHAQRKTAVVVRKKTAVNVPIYVPRIKTFLTSLNTFCVVRKKKYGGKDVVSKKLLACKTAIIREFKKQNICNPSMTKTFCHIKTHLRGVTNVPVGVKMTYPKLCRFIRETVKKDVVKCLYQFKTTCAPMYNELKKLEVTLQKQLTMYRGKKVLLKIDPALKRRHLVLTNHIVKFKTTWFKRLNTLAIHGDKTLKITINTLKKHIDEIYKLSRRNQTIINRYAKTVKPKKGYKIHTLLTASHIALVERILKTWDASWTCCRLTVAKFCDQLKAIKLIK